jgi:hypothetical protein
MAQQVFQVCKSPRSHTRTEQRSPEQLAGLAVIVGRQGLEGE